MDAIVLKLSKLSKWLCQHCFDSETHERAIASSEHLKVNERVLMGVWRNIKNSTPFIASMVVAFAILRGTLN